VESVGVAVIGSGVAGAAAAWRLALRGHEVVLIEQFEIGHNRGSSHGASRIFRLAYDHPWYVRMAQMALPLWRELEQQSGRDLLTVTGGLDAGTEAQIQQIAYALEANGAEFEILDPQARKERFPQFELNEFGLYSPDSGVLAADASVGALSEAARTAGAEVLEKTRVSKVITGDDDVVLEMPTGTVKARRCVLAAGGWNVPLLERTGIQLPLRVSCEQLFYFEGGDIPVFIHRNGISYYAVPKIDSAPGVKVGEHATGRTATADHRPFDIELEGEARVIDFVSRTLPGLDPKPVAAETCLYTLTPDEDFVLDTRGPLIIASACSGHGFKFGPLVGEILADLATGAEPTVDISHFSASRFNK
jgi:sarcosine oxidase